MTFSKLLSSQNLTITYNIIFHWIFVCFIKIDMIYLFLVKHVRSIAFVSILFGLLCTYVVMRSKYENLKNQLPPHLVKYMNHRNNKKNSATIDIASLKIKLEQSNSKPNITNIDKYSDSFESSYVFLIQVHKDIKSLRYLIMSLAQVTEIHTTLLIFSHSFYSEPINQLVQSIDFCKVIQLFYPYSLQLNPHKFPGVDPNDCPKKKIKRSNFNCLKRNAALTEHKQHWWWKVSFVFERMNWFRTYEKPIIFLEENNYVAPNILLILQYALTSFTYFPHTEVLSFGRSLTKNIDMDLLSVESWRPPFDVGLAFNRTTWNKILSFSAQYCMYDDNSWSYSLLNLFRMFPRGYVSMVACVTPRVLNINEFKNVKQNFKTYTEMFNTLDVFPKKVKAVFVYGPEGLVETLPKNPPMGNGGWSDLRDQVLCLDPLMTTTTAEPRYYDADFTNSSTVIAVKSNT